MPKLKLYENSRELIRQASQTYYSWEVVVFDVNSVILSKCHSGESLFEYYLQEFQYGGGKVQTTTNNLKDCRVETTLKNVSGLFGYGNIVWQENPLTSDGRAGSSPARATMPH